MSGQLFAGLVSAALGGGAVTALSTYLVSRRRIDKVEAPTASADAASTLTAIATDLVTGMRGEINELRTTVSRQSQRLDDQARTIERLEDTLNERDRELAELREQVKARDATIADLQLQLDKAAKRRTDRN